MLERRQTGAQNSRLVQHLERAAGPGDLQLVASCALECAPAIGADLRAHAEGAKEPESAARDGRVGDIELDGHLSATSQVDTAGGVEKTGELRKPVAFAARRDRRELVSQVVRQ
jgi:hypothetical protein